MKIGVLSDIHVDLEHPRPDVVIEPLVAVIRETNVDAVVVAGDVANDYVTTLMTLDKIESRAGVRCIFVPGNHDIWNEHHPRKSAWEIYDALKEFPGNLAAGPMPLPLDWVAVGDLGWYDYSYGAPEYTCADFDRMQIGDRLWQDKVKAVWGRSTLDMHRYFYEKLEAQLESCRGKKIIMVTHVLPIADFTVPQTGPPWDYLNAFLGSRAYGELALRYGVRYAICGHVHYRKEVTHKRTRFVCNCLNYASQWVTNNDPLREIRHVFKTITLA